MNNRKWTWVLSLVVALGVAAGGVSAAAASPVADQLPQVQLPSAARFVISGIISSEGQTVPINGSGAFSDQNAMLDVTLTAPEGATSGPDKITLGAIVVDGKLYVKTSGVDAGTDDKWYVIDTGTLTEGIPGAVMDMPGSLTDIETMLGAAVSSKEVGKEAIGGAPTTKYQIDVDLQKLAAATGGSTAGTEGSTLTMFLWVGDKDMYVHQFNMMLSVDSSSGDITLNLAADLTITFSDFDVPVTITAPENAEPLDLSSVLGGDVLGSIGMPNVEMSGSGATAGMPRTGSGGPDNTLMLVLLALSVSIILTGAAIRHKAYKR